MPCAYISVGLKKKVRIVNHQPSSQMFDARNIHFISCSSCFAQNCNFIHAVNIYLHNSQGKYKVKDTIYIHDESMKIRSIPSLPFHL